MKIELHKIKIKDIRNGYFSNIETNEVWTEVESTSENGIKQKTKLNIRPAYQRNFVYKEDKRDEVIRTVKKGFPLNVMYWVKNTDGSFEVLDGQQRTISILEYIKEEGISFSLNDIYFHSLSPEDQNRFLDYELMIYICEGEYQEKLDWFKVINIAGEVLTQQELRNAMFVGPWLYDAKRHFSKIGCVASEIGKDLAEQNTNRQELLETALCWIVYANENKYRSIDEYMSAHQKDKNAKELYDYFCNVIDWVKKIFPKKNKFMKNLPWGEYYADYKQKTLNPFELEKQVEELMKDSEVQNKKGIYKYLLSEDEKHLNLRTFEENDKATAFAQCGGICAHCKKQFSIEEMEADHITPWSRGGKTTLENLQMLCKNCNRTKSNK